jgi:hypothetical protein
VDGVGLEGLDPFVAPDGDAVLAHGVGDQGAHVLVERGHRLLGGGDDRDLGAAVEERLRHLQADVSAADDHDARRPLGVHRGEEAVGVLEVLHAVDVGPVDPGQRRAHRDGARPDVEVVVGERVGAVVLVVADLDLPLGGVDGDGLLPQADVDAVLVAELLRRPRHEPLDAEDLAADEVRDAARAVARPPALLEGHDLEVGLAAPGLAGGGHAAGVAADHDETSCLRSHAKVSTWPRRTRGASGRTAGTTSAGRRPSAIASTAAAST